MVLTTIRSFLPADSALLLGTVGVFGKDKIWGRMLLHAKGINDVFPDKLTGLIAGWRGSMRKLDNSKLYIFMLNFVEF